MTPKEFVTSFYNSDFGNEAFNPSEFFHEDCQLNWNSSTGFKQLNYSDIVLLFKNFGKAYASARNQVSHMLQDGNFMTIRYTMYVHPIESPDEEEPMAHFITIWELKDGKLYRGHEISQLADESHPSLKSFLEIKL
ncbi:nuclear transport factor 2 family protein [Mangrovimonas xylaniphaga]|uniref:nuclear transport factor 2 family protein n=1 Tax=Mangrovimonas xylaniphaga TaxID=1645915 RepID=UPI0006B4F179|nr:nuclear transport factor 2 family protein [Mangrovimonas xylaniphaga]